MGPMGCPETSILKYHSLLSNIPEQRSSHFDVFILTSKVARHEGRMGEERGVYRVLLRKPEGRRPLGRPRRRWVYNIRMEFQEVGFGYMYWIGLAPG